MVGSRKPSLSTSSNQKRLFIGRSARIAQHERVLRFNNEVKLRHYSSKIPANDSCGFMKISTPLAPDYTVKSMLQLFNYNRGILLYQGQLVYIHLELLLNSNPDDLFNDILTAGFLDECDRPVILLITPTSENQCHIESIMNFFNSINDDQYFLAESYYLYGLFQKITGHQQAQPPEDRVTELRSHGR